MPPLRRRGRRWPSARPLSSLRGARGGADPARRALSPGPSLREQAKATVLVVGQDNSGKTAIVNCLRQDREDIAPTIGWSVSRFTVGKTKLTEMDMSGQSKYRDLWDSYYTDVQAVVFVVDASDRKRHKEAHGVLSTVLGSGELSGLPFLAFCNKMDLAEALPPAELARALDIINLSDRAWHLQPSCALSGEGVQDGISWLVARVKGR